MNRDQNGNPVYRNVCRESDGWGATVWWGSGHVTTVRRHVYRTREQARNACISDDERAGVIAIIC